MKLLVATTVLAVLAQQVELIAASEHRNLRRPNKGDNTYYGKIHVVSRHLQADNETISVNGDQEDKNEEAYQGNVNVIPWQDLSTEIVGTVFEDTNRDGIQQDEGKQFKAMSNTFHLSSC